MTSSARRLLTQDGLFIVRRMCARIRTYLCVWVVGECRSEPPRYLGNSCRCCARPGTVESLNRRLRLANPKCLALPVTIWTTPRAKNSIEASNPYLSAIAFWHPHASRIKTAQNSGSASVYAVSTIA